MSQKKSELRRLFLEQRSQMLSLNHQQKSEKISNLLLKEVKKNKWEKLFLYSPYKNEPDLLSLFTHEDHAVQVALPVIGKNQSMDFYEWDKKISSLQSNRHHILEPKPSEAKKLKNVTNTKKHRKHFKD